jgi:hypothetical protein
MESKINQTKEWGHVTKADALNLFAFWLPQSVPPRTKKAAISTFCEKGWVYSEDDVKTALTNYEIYLRNEDEEVTLPARESDSTVTNRKRRRLDDSTDDGKGETPKELRPKPVQEKEMDTGTDQPQVLGSLQDQVLQLRSELEAMKVLHPGEQNLCDELASVFPDSLLKVSKLTKGERKKLVKNMPKYSCLPKVIDKTEGDCLEKVKNRKVKVAITQSWPLIQRQNLAMLQVGMYARTLLRAEFLDNEVVVEVDRALIAITAMAVDNARGNLAHMKKLLHEELGLKSVLEKPDNEEVFFGKKELEIVSRHSEFDKQIRFRQNKNRPEGTGFQFRGRPRGRGRFQGGGQPFRPYQKNPFYGRGGGQGYSSYGRGNGNRGRGSYGSRGSFGNKTGKYNNSFNPRTRGGSE